MNTTAATYQIGDRLHFRPSPARAPHGTAIPEGPVTVVEVVDHGSATAYSPRFTYVVTAADGRRQGTDDRELTVLEDSADRHMANRCREVIPSAFGAHCHCTLEYNMPDGERRPCMVCDLTTEERRAVEITDWETAILGADPTPTANPHYACDTHGAVCPTGEHVSHTPGNPYPGCTRCAPTATPADWRCNHCAGHGAHTATCDINRPGEWVQPGMRVVFTNPPACFADLRNAVFTVEAVVYGMGGMMSADTRASIAAGHAYLVMVGDDGRKIGATSDNVTADWRCEFCGGGDIHSFSCTANTGTYRQ